MTNSDLRALLKDAYLAGFQESAEGYNAELLSQGKQEADMEAAFEEWIEDREVAQE